MVRQHRANVENNTDESYRSGMERSSEGPTLGSPAVEPAVGEKIAAVSNNRNDGYKIQGVIPLAEGQSCS